MLLLNTYRYLAMEPQPFAVFLLSCALRMHL